MVTIYAQIMYFYIITEKNYFEKIYKSENP